MDDEKRLVIATEKPSGTFKNNLEGRILHITSGNMPNLDDTPRWRRLVPKETTGKTMNNEPIYGFEGENSFLSNFYRLEGTVETAEHLFQAAKAVKKNDAAWIMSSGHPSDAKKRGRVVQMRPD